MSRQKPEGIDLAAEQAVVDSLQEQIDCQSGGFLAEREQLQQAQLEYQALQHEYSQIERQIAAGATRLTGLREEWQRISSQQWSGDEICPTCRRPLPAESVAEAVDAFDRAKAERLQQNEQDGKALTSELQGQRKHLEEITAAMGAAIDRVSTMQAQLQQNPANDLATLRKQLAFHQENVARAREYARTASRITELEAQHKQAVAQLEEAEYHISLCERFTRRKASVIENKINGLFTFARFNLFRRQVNGEVAEICETAIDGVPFSDLNTAARINAGLDIINTLSRHYGLTAPIFIDNAESVIQLLPVSAQVIRLVVSPTHDTLRIEMEESSCQTA